MIKIYHVLGLIASSSCAMVCLQQTSTADTRLLSVDLQSSYDTQGRDFTGVEAEAASASALFSTANIWNHIGTSGFDVSTDVAGLVDSTGAATAVGFKTSAHSAYGRANFGPSDLLNDYFYWSGSQNPLAWELNGLQPGGTYALFLNGSQSDATPPRSFTVTVDLNGDGSLADETGAVVVSPPGTFIATVIAGADGRIVGTGAALGGEPNWGGFQLSGPIPLAGPPLISVDLQSSYDTQGRDFTGVEAEAASASALFSTANIWNHIGTSGFDVSTDVAGLVDSTGAATAVGFKTSAHSAYGRANFGPSDLLNDYFYWSGSQNPLAWELNGLQPGGTYALFLNGSQSDATPPRSFTVTVDLNGDGSLADETGAVVVSPPGTFIATVIAGADGRIVGTGAALGGEPNWGGFQLVGPLPCPDITATLTGGSLVCPGQQATLFVVLSGGTPPYTVTLNNGATASGPSPQSFLVTASTTPYQVAGAQDANGCEASPSGSESVTLDTTPPTVLCQSAVQVILDAQGNGTLAASAVDGGSTSSCGIQSLSVSPSTFTCANLGPNQVTLTATSNNGASASCQTTVTVVNNTPPTIGSCPPNQTLNATTAAGAVVSFPTPSASDTCLASASCLPASNSTFPIGTTSVTCTASDGANVSSSCTFSVTVKGAAAQISDLIAIVNALPKVPVTVKNGLLAKLQAALKAFSANDVPTACAAMQDFINLVNAQTGKKVVAPSSAADLLTAARQIRRVIGCP